MQEQIELPKLISESDRLTKEMTTVKGETQEPTKNVPEIATETKELSKEITDVIIRTRDQTINAVPTLYKTEIPIKEAPVTTTGVSENINDALELIKEVQDIDSASSEVTSEAWKSIGCLSGLQNGITNMSISADDSTIHYTGTYGYE